MAETKSQDAIALLKEDHRAVEKLFKEFENAKGDGRKQKLAQRICLELTIHTKIEEEIFYPAFRQARDDSENEKIYFESLEEHRAAGGLVLPDLQKTPVDSEKFGGRAKVLKELIEHHADEEEEEMFERARKIFPEDELEALGEQLEKRKKELMKELGP